MKLMRTAAIDRGETGNLGFAGIAFNTTNYLYDGVNSIMEMDSAGNVLARYLARQEVDQPLAEFRSATANYYEADGLGSVTSLSNPTATLANAYAYDSFGKLTVSTGAVLNPFQYTGREFDPETGIYEYRARYFDPTVGRFISEDPIRFRGGANFYRYVANNPMDFRDPLGLCPPANPLVPANPCNSAGGAPDPSVYQAKGQEAQSNAVLDFYYLSEFMRGRSLDAQVQYGGSPAYANYAFGVYMSAAGYTLDQALSGADIIAEHFSHYPASTTMDPNHTFTPMVNVMNITYGFNAQRSGTLCKTGGGPVATGGGNAF
jgi:RHS repeat-associated protein